MTSAPTPHQWRQRPHGPDAHRLRREPTRRSQIAAQIDVGDDFAAAVPECDAVIDFSHHSTIEPVLARCVEQQKTLVIGTTGHTDAQVAAIRHAAAHIPIVFAPNYSVGVNTLFWLTRKAAEILGPASISKSSRCITA